MMIRLKREGARAPREIKAPKINSSQFLRPVELTVEQQKTMAFQMYIKSILGSINQLGRNNAVRLLAYRYQIDSKEASSILDFFGDVDKESDRIVMEQKRQNCESFEAAMSSLSNGLAADRMALAESQTGAASADYYEGIIDRLDSSLSSGASEKILEGVESMRGNLKTFNRDTPAYFAANSIDPASYYQSRCELLKQK